MQKLAPFPGLGMRLMYMYVYVYYTQTVHLYIHVVHNIEYSPTFEGVVLKFRYYHTRQCKQSGECGLPCFYSPVVFTMIHRNRRVAKRQGGCKVKVGDERSKHNCTYMYTV